MSYQSYRPGGGEGPTPPRGPRSERDRESTNFGSVTIEKAHDYIADGRCPWCKYFHKFKGKVWGHLYWILTGEAVEDAGRRVHDLPTVYKLLVENEKTRDEFRHWDRDRDRDNEEKDTHMDVEPTTNYVHSGTQTTEEENMPTITSDIEVPKKDKNSEIVINMVISVQRIQDRLPVLEPSDLRYTSPKAVNSSTFCDLVLQFTSYSEPQPPGEKERDILITTEGLESRIVIAAWAEFDIYGHFGKNDRWREALALRHGGLREACQFISDDTTQMIMQAETTEEMMPDRVARPDACIISEETPAEIQPKSTLRRQSLKQADEFLSNIQIPTTGIDETVQPSPAKSPKSNIKLSIHTKRTESFSAASGGTSAGYLLSPKRQAGSPKEYIELPPATKKRRLSTDNDSGCEPDTDQHKARSLSIAVPENKSDDDSGVPLIQMRRTVSMGAVTTKRKPPDSSSKWKAVETSSTYQRGVARKPAPK